MSIVLYVSTAHVMSLKGICLSPRQPEAVSAVSGGPGPQAQTRTLQPHHGGLREGHRPKPLQSGDPLLMNATPHPPHRAQQGRVSLELRWQSGLSDGGAGGDALSGLRGARRKGRRLVPCPLSVVSTLSSKAKEAAITARKTPEQNCCLSSSISFVHLFIFSTT